MLVTVIAVMVFVLAAFELAAFPARLMPVAAEALAVAGPVAWCAGRPRYRQIFTVAEHPRGRATASDPTVAAGTRCDVPRRSLGLRPFRIAVFLE